MKATKTELTLEEQKLAFLSHLVEKGLGMRRINEYNRIIEIFYNYLSERGVLKLSHVTKKLLIEMQYHMYKCRYQSDNTVKRTIYDMAMYYRYLYHNNLTHTDPLINIKLIPAPEEKNLKKIRKYYTFAELINRWANESKRTGLSYITIRNKIHLINIFRKYLESRGIASIYKVNESDIRDYLKYLTVKSHSKIRCLQAATYLGQFYKYLKRSLLINKYPIEFMDLVEYRKYLDREIKEQTKDIEPQPVIKTEYHEMADKFRGYFLSLGRNEGTLKSYINALRIFKTFMETKNITSLKKITRPDIVEFQQYLGGCMDFNGKPCTNVLIHSRMIAIRAFFKYLVISGYLNCDPASNIQLINGGGGLPHNGMTEEEALKILGLPDINTPVGIRDRAIMEVMYSTGMRSNELVHLEINDIDFANGLIRINCPKGGKKYQRVSAIGKIACSFVKKYLNEARPLYVSNGCNRLFLTKTGIALARNRINDIIKKYLFKSGIRKRISSHSWRVTCATLMLKNNADIRYIQEQLGHRSIQTTQIYTRLVPKDLKRVHSQCHPREIGV